MCAGGVQQLEGVPDRAPLHDAEGHDKGHNAQPGLHGGLPRGRRITDGAPPPLAPAADSFLINRRHRAAAPTPFPRARACDDAVFRAYNVCLSVRIYVSVYK